MMITKVAEIVAQKTNNPIEIQAYPAGQLGGSRDWMGHCAGASSANDEKKLSCFSCLCNWGSDGKSSF
jgi:hypothetical protein